VLLLLFAPRLLISSEGSCSTKCCIERGSAGVPQPRALLREIVPPTPAKDCCCCGLGECSELNASSLNR
jgi:hypothetical protein